MQSTIKTTATTRPMLWTGRILTALAALFLLFDGVTHVMQIAPVAEAMTQLGYPANAALTIGIIQLICLLLYLVPSTSLLGAVLLTAYLGGAVTTNLRIGAPLFSNILFPVYVGLFIWGGLYLRDERLRALFPLRK
ncbi:membrane protein [Reticulibacter mediterranei]|uniref:Membrane protein n=1 Tax=Reticulibacter mediterranei TaxID=2778369 RepID=A0A8J3N4E6_9CHLR|nr:DoxX family protein [Reticulibacter mediterranei]GHO97944.1 membrane protein [Reticulibacter mediterranei]